MERRMVNKLQSYHCCFHDNYFKNIITKYFQFNYINIVINAANRNYKVDLFYNEIDKIYQIGVIGYGGIFPAPQSCFVLEEIIVNLKIIHDIDIKKIIIPPLFPCELSVENLNKYLKTEMTTQIIVMQEFRELGYRLFKGSVRTDIRCAEKNQITVHCYNKNNRSELMFFYDLYIKTMKKVNANYCISLPLIEDLLNDERNAELYLAYYNGKIVSGSIILKSKNNIFYWINASDSVSLKFKPNHKVLSHIITKYSDIDYINLGFSHSDTLRQFKKTWGAKDFKYYVFEKAF